MKLKLRPKIAYQQHKMNFWDDRICLKSNFSDNQSCVTFYDPQTVAHQTPLSMGFSRQEYRSGLPFPTPGIFPNQGPTWVLLHWQADSLPLSHLGRYTMGRRAVLRLRLHLFTYSFTLSSQLQYLLSSTLCWVLLF